ncbi:concanavalin A-like lectin/glucanase domain-containing protein [Kickxella alabastrina]|uniref:concanavalin A-like lectin/glucanase domain-containing protein n=1 Tax=Kickxella alabastrina TaxID=61397 RepID=UPI002220F025|nr:concanavalin A-like lectin/glucanase domain-containing protein [Kickxella alabastrina]KAI7817945.1 concanavalin A-like lectin/glucanase domain-containing protein [Kickxella alabastrina]
MKFTYCSSTVAAIAFWATSNGYNLWNNSNRRTLKARQSQPAGSFIDFTDREALGKFNVEWCPQNTYQTQNSVVWRLTPECGTTIVFPWDFQYGKIEGRIRAAHGSGVVSTPADELDWEWVGRDTLTAQSMYFRVDPVPQYLNTPGDMAAGFHNYAIELNKDSVKWYIDDWLVRTLPVSMGVPFPVGASRPRMGVWDGTQNQRLGWHWPFTAEMQWFKFTPYC